MIKTLIIDDNKIMREYFQTMIDWPSKGFELIATANNGNTGWKAFCDYKPDLVITDVKMPGMSGLEVAQKIKSQSPDTMIVFISSYDEFSYVKGAMELGVYDYILKHETRGECFDQKLAAIRQAYESQHAHRKTYYEGQLALTLSSFQKTNPKLNEIFPDHYSLLLFELEEVLSCFCQIFHYPTAEFTEEHISMILEHFPDIVAGVQTEKNQYVLLIKKDSNLQSNILKMAYTFYSNYKFRIYTMIVCEDQDISVCIQHFQEQRQNMQEKFFKKYSSNIAPSMHEKPLYDSRKDYSDDLLSVLENADRSAMHHLMDELTYQICNTNDYQTLCKVSNLLLGYISDKKKTDFSANCKPDYSDDLPFWTNAEDIFHWFKEKLNIIYDSFEANPAHHCSKPICSAIDFILEHYSNPYLNVGDIAEHTGLDIHHLNRLMKEETNITTIKWLTNIRIEKAKELLIEGRKLTDIYQAVGYSNMSYFSNVFKKNCGETPLEYRRRILEKEN